jgi:ABC-type branched-subunit amino acid transport system substrate-binding protein
LENKTPAPIAQNFLKKRDPFRLGVINDWSSPQLGRDFADALRLTFRKALAAHTLDRDIELVEKNCTNGASAAAAYRELAIDSQIIAVVGIASTEAQLAIAPLADEACIPTISAGPSIEFPGLWRFVMPYALLADEGYRIAEHIARSGRKRLSALCEQSAIADETLEHLRIAAKDNQLQLDTASIARNASADAVAEVAAKALEDGAQAIAYFGSSDDLTKILSGVNRAVGDRDVGRYLNSAWSLYAAAHADQLNALQGWFGLERYSADNPLASQFAKEFSAAFGREAQHTITGIAHDTGRLMAEAIHTAKPRYRDAIRHAMEQIMHVQSACGGPGAMYGYYPYDHTAYKGVETSRPIVVTVQSGRVIPA